MTCLVGHHLAYKAYKASLSKLITLVEFGSRSQAIAKVTYVFFLNIIVAQVLEGGPDFLS